MVGRVQGEWWAAAGGVVVAIAGWVAGSVLLALAGMLGTVTTLLLLTWQRSCLTGVSYARTLRQTRATFGEEVGLDIQLINDKLLPLTWLHVEDQVPQQLTIRGGTLLDDGPRRTLHQLLPMLPFQRVRRRLVVVCDRRGEHTFGPARLSSGDPVGLRDRAARNEGRQALLVFPKLFALHSSPVASRVPLGDVRAAVSVIDDPSRVAGVREYREGDPLRHVDWRATARSGALLVREFEPTSSERVALFLDTRAEQLRRMADCDDLLEFTIAVGASMIAELLGRGVATGVYASGAVDGRAIVQEPASSGAALPAVLELLARAETFGPSTIAELLVVEGARLRRGTSIVIVAPDFPESTLTGLGELRRRAPVTAVWIASDIGRPPPADLVEIVREVHYDGDWTTREFVEVAE